MVPNKAECFLVPLKAKRYAQHKVLRVERQNLCLIRCSNQSCPNYLLLLHLLDFYILVELLYNIDSAHRHVDRKERLRVTISNEGSSDNHVKNLFTCKTWSVACYIENAGKSSNSSRYT